MVSCARKSYEFSLGYRVEESLRQTKGDSRRQRVLWVELRREVWTEYRNLHAVQTEWH